MVATSKVKTKVSPCAQDTAPDRGLTDTPIPITIVSAFGWSVALVVVSGLVSEVEVVGVFGTGRDVVVGLVIEEGGLVDGTMDGRFGSVGPAEIVDLGPAPVSCSPPSIIRATTRMTVIAMAVHPRRSRKQFG